MSRQAIRADRGMKYEIWHRSCYCWRSFNPFVQKMLKYISFRSSLFFKASTVTRSTLATSCSSDIAAGSATIGILPSRAMSQKSTKRADIVMNGHIDHAMDHETEAEKNHGKLICCFDGTGNRKSSNSPCHIRASSMLCYFD